MKKSNLWNGLMMIAAGAACLAAALLWDTPLSSLLCGFFGGLAAPGAMQVYRYVKWSRPENAPLYRKRLEQERIDLRDERKEMLRNRAGRSAYILGLLLTAAAVIVFSVLGQMKLVEGSRLIVLFLGGFLAVQYAAGIFFYRRLEKKY